MELKPQSPATTGTGREGGSWLHRLRVRLLPEMPDFYGLLVEQCETTAQGTGTLVEFFRERSPELADRVRKLEHEGDRLKLRNLEILHHSFSTPMDREAFYQAVERIDDILNYAKAAVGEVELFRVAPDDHAATMAVAVHSGTLELLEGLKVLEKQPKTAEGHARAAMKSERTVEKAFRAALVDLFDPERLATELGRARGDPAGDGESDVRLTRVVVLVSEVFKHREIYRHLSNAADHVARAAQVLEDVIAKAN